MGRLGITSSRRCTPSAIPRGNLSAPITRRRSSLRYGSTVLSSDTAIDLNRPCFHVWTPPASEGNIHGALELRYVLKTRSTAFSASDLGRTAAAATSWRAAQGLWDVSIHVNAPTRPAVAPPAGDHDCCEILAVQPEMPLSCEDGPSWDSPSFVLPTNICSTGGGRLLLGTTSLPVVELFGPCHNLTSSDRGNEGSHRRYRWNRAPDPHEGGAPLRWVGPRGEPGSSHPLCAFHQRNCRRPARMRAAGSYPGLPGRHRSRCLRQADRDRGRRRAGHWPPLRKARRCRHHLAGGRRQDLL
jgi:hypothetical protein